MALSGAIPRSYGGTMVGIWGSGAGRGWSLKEKEVYVTDKGHSLPADKYQPPVPTHDPYHHTHLSTVILMAVET